MQQQQSRAKWDAVIRPRNGWFDIDVKGLLKYKDLILLMVKRNFTVMYKQNVDEGDESTSSRMGATSMS